jgi:AraC-like DNA-binding protein
MNLDLRIGASSVRVMVQIAAGRGLDAAACVRGTGIGPDILDDPLAEITIRQELAVMRNVLRHCGAEPGLGVLAGAEYHMAMHGMFGLCLATGRTLRESLTTALPYVDLGWALGPVNFTEADGIAMVSFDDSAVPADVQAFLAERNVAASRVIHRELLGADLPLLAVHFRHCAPPDTTAHVALFGVEPTFNAGDISLRIPAEQLDIPLPQGNEWVQRGYEVACHELLTRRRARTGVSGAVRDLLVQRPGELPDTDAVARALSVSPRTLARRLDDEGTSFRALVDEVRETLAEQLLRSDGMTTEQVARRLGYADPASFIRAFKRWKVQTPQQYRTGAAEITAKLRVPAT